MTCNEFPSNNFVEISRIQSDLTFLGEDISSENKGYDPERFDVKREREECAGIETGSTGIEGQSSFFSNKNNLKDLQKRVSKWPKSILWR